MQGLIELDNKLVQPQLPNTSLRLPLSIQYKKGSFRQWNEPFRF